MAITNTCLRSALRRAIYLSTTVPVLLSAANALAQQGMPSEEAIEEIVTTGSRIARDPNLAGALPVQSIDTETIALSGEFSLSDVVNDVPALLSSLTAEQSIDSGLVTDGANVLDLRGLGLNRTLVLVNGRRHVGGVSGTTAVDIGSIPADLVERVEVLSGGASAIYGADAVTGVVNFILKDDFEGFNVDANYGISGDGDGQQLSLSATWGTNFADDRGNIAISVEYATDEGLKFRDRPNSVNGTGGDWVNPMLRFQQGDIDASATPNFAQYFNPANGLVDFGLSIPNADDFIAQYEDAFGSTPTLTAAELSLIDRAANAPQRAVYPDLTFPFTSGYGYVINGNPYTFDGFDPDEPIDLNNNGTPDCYDSFHGWNSTFGGNGEYNAFGVVGGCWVADAAGNYTAVEDGLVSGNFQGFGGSSIDVYRQGYYDVLLPDDRVSVNLLGDFELTDTSRLFWEAKYVKQMTDSPADPNSFWDLLPGFNDNPFLPAFLQPVADATGAIAITVDPIAFRSVTDTERDTVRAVVGIEGEFDNAMTYEFALNYGRHDRRIESTNQVINDRFFAAIDAVSGPNGPACRSSVDPNAPALNTPFEIPAYEAGYFSFTPGDGQCVPLNIWAGATGYTQEALDFVAVDTWSDLVIDQLVVSAIFTGDSANWFELPGGPMAFAFGGEYRDESSDATFDEWQRGVLPPGSPAGQGTLLGDISDNTSLVFRPQLATRNEKGSYDVTDIFVEASVPLLADLPGARELTAEFAARYADYSTIGEATTWKANIIYAPIDDLTLRASYSEAVRAPNITELFAPETGLNFRPDDPCDAAQIAAIRADDPTLADQTQANCVAVFNSIGLDPFDANGNYVFADPLSASFGGVVSGNVNLNEETAETLTAGLVFQPGFLDGFTLTVDYWDIAIDDAIQAVSSQNIVDGCYQGATLNDDFCQLSARNSDPGSAQFGGFNFIRQTTINFAKVETSGIDFQAKYAFEVGAHGFDVSVQGTKVNEIDFFQNPLDLTEVNPELEEVNRPEYAGNIFLNWTFGDFGAGWQSQYIGEMLYTGIEVETYESLYGPTVLRDATWLHDINAYWDYSDRTRIYGGIKNVSEEVPFITASAWPASPRGRFFFFGVNTNFN
jgi:outer membrane receptor protein involved in Fe transport